MTSPIPHNITTDELLGLVAGTLAPADFSRVAAAVKNDPALQAQLASLEQIRYRMELAMALAPSDAQAHAMATRVLARTGTTEGLPASQSVPVKPASRASLTERLQQFFSASPSPARWAYALVLVQAVGMAWLANGALQSPDPSTAEMRSADIESKQLGEVPSNVVISVSFEASTPEATVRGLLLDIEAQIIAGPTQLGQYKISVARNRRELALGKLKEAPFVAQSTEVETRTGPPSDRTEGQK